MDTNDFVSRIVQDASKQVKELKRQKSLVPSPNKKRTTNIRDRSLSHDSSNLHLSSIGEDIEWSPKERSPQNKKKGFVKLSNYDN